MGSCCRRLARRSSSPPSRVSRWYLQCRCARLRLGRRLSALRAPAESQTTQLLSLRRATRWACAPSSAAPRLTSRTRGLRPPELCVPLPFCRWLAHATAPAHASACVPGVCHAVRPQRPLQGAGAARRAVSGGGPFVPERGHQVRTLWTRVSRSASLAHAARCAGSAPPRCTGWHPRTR